MSPVAEIFHRMDLQHIREFLLHGVEQPEISADTYDKRIDDAERKMVECLRLKYPEIADYEKITDKVYNALSVTQDVFMEIGIIAGMTLAAQMFRGKTE
jgi:hypothetical protein